VEKSETQRGQFITLEGTEGAGKSTHLAWIETYLETKGVPFIMTREPGGTPISEAIRALLHDPKHAQMSDLTELLLVFAARAQHLESKIIPALNAGTWVVSDRFTDATYAYQGAARGGSMEVITQLEKLVQGAIRPDLTLVLDVPVALGQARVAQRAEQPQSQLDRFEQEKQQFFEAVRACYLDRAQREPARYRVIDASQSLSQVQAQTQQLLDLWIKAHR